MRKVIISAMAVLMLFSSVGCTEAGADEAWKGNTGEINLGKMSVTGSGVSVENNTVKITRGGDFTVTGTLDGGSIYVNTDDKVQLRLSGVSITSSDGPAIFFDNTEKGFVTIAENTENFLADSKEYTVEDADAALFSNDDLEINGSGTLTITGNCKHGIASDDLSIESGNIVITAYEHTIKANDALNVLGGNITVTSETGKGMKAEKELTIDGGDITITTKESEGIESKGTLVINGGNIKIDAFEDGINTGTPDTTETDTAVAEDSEKDEESITDMQKRPQMPDGEAPAQRGERGMRGQMRDGQTPPEIPEGEKPGRRDGRATPPEIPEGQERGQRPGNGEGFSRIDEETAEAHSITINGGNIYIKSGGDGIDSNGNLTINGGTVTIDGPENSANGPLDSEGTMAINGGTVITLSASGMIQLPRSSDGQNILRVTFSELQAAGSTVSVKDSDGREIMSSTASGAYQTLIFSSKELKADGEYTILIDGSEKEKATITAGLTAVGSGFDGFGGFGGGRGPGGFGGRRPLQ